MSEKTISAEQVAILAERVDTLLLDRAELKGLILGISAQQSQLTASVGIFNERLTAIDNNQRRLFQLADEHAAEIERLKSDVKVHSWTWKLVGTAAVLSLSLVGWVFGELRGLSSQDNRHENRISILEFIVGGRNPRPLPEDSKP